MPNSVAKLTQKGLFNYSIIAAEIFPMLDDVQLDEAFFTTRERDVLHHLLREKTVNQISHLTALTSEAVDHHIESIKSKMQLTAQSEFVVQLTCQFAKAGWYF